MQKEDKPRLPINLDDLIRIDKNRKSEKIKIETTFGEYLEKFLSDDPKISQNSSARFQAIIDSTGFDSEGRSNLFREELYGIDLTISDVISHIRKGASRASSGKLLLLLTGPPGSGKSTIVNILICALEKYNIRPVFRIKGCPINEEPLHLLPRHLRSQVSNGLGVTIEGDLCPLCRHMLKTNFTDIIDGRENVRWQEVPVETFTFSEQDVRGISSFAPSDEKTSDITALTIRENINVTATKGYDDPRSFDIGGLIGRAQRGIFESRETCSNDPSVLAIFFSLCEEKQMMVPGATNFPHLSIDTFTIGHTNLNVFMKFSSNKDFEGLHNRFFIVECPYALTIKDEIKLYKKLIEKESDFIALQKKHIAPGALEIAALFAVLSRLTESKMGVNLLIKAKLYNGDMALHHIADNNKLTFDLRTLRQEGRSSPDISKREGMFGLSPRDILVALNTALSETKENEGCLTPISTIKALRNMFQHRTGIAPEMVEKYLGFLGIDSPASVIIELKELVLNPVNKAFLRAYEDLSSQIFDNYMEQIEIDAIQKMKYFRPDREMEMDVISGKPREADQKFLREVELHVPVADSEAISFRSDILQAKAIMKERFSYETYTPLRKAVEKKLLEENRALLKIVIKKDASKNELEKKRADDLYSELLNDGFCEVCAHEIIEKAGDFLV